VVNIPLRLHANRLPSTFMLCLGCAGVQKKGGLATEVSEICSKNSKKKDMNIRTLDS
jgi:hypothetical protein